MITEVQFENFKSLKSVSVPLERLTVLVGPNGCGKSSVLQGTELITSLLTDKQSYSQNTIRPLDSFFAGIKSLDWIKTNGAN